MRRHASKDDNYCGRSLPSRPSASVQRSASAKNSPSGQKPLPEAVGEQGTFPVVDDERTNGDRQGLQPAAVIQDLLRRRDLSTRRNRAQSIHHPLSNLISKRDAANALLR